MATVDDPGADSARVQRLADFINADDWREKRRLVEQDARLASQQTAQLLDGWIGQLDSQGDVQSAEDLRRYAVFLALVRTEGVSSAFETLAESAARLAARRCNASTTAARLTRRATPWTTRSRRLSARLPPPHGHAAPLGGTARA
jgi:hypothetical protein